MKGNTISLNPLNESGKFWLQKTLQLFKIQEYGKGVHYVYEFKKNRKKLQKPPIGKQCGIAECYTELVAEQRIAKNL